MATLVLTAVGTAVAGPIGGAIGAAIGYQADALLFAPKVRQGPRLGELAVQTSSYGTPIPKIFGTMRAAGTVIWSTDLIEDQSVSGGGKGGAKTAQYSYSASFAVAISARPILGVRRIWADGKLLRGAAGDFKSETGFRLYLGDEEQEPDPLIASLEGIGNTPAFRGTAYAMFENFQLADYANRIPSLSFEIDADAEQPSIGAIAAELSGGAVVDGGTRALQGFAATGDSIRGAIEAIAEAASLSLAEREAGLELGRAGEPAIHLAEEDLRAAAGEMPGRTEIGRAAAGTAPEEVSIAYYDSARDYQTGLQRAARSGIAAGGRGRGLRIALPAVLAAEAAKGLAETRLADIWAARTSARLSLTWRYGDIRPGALLSIGGQPGLWQVRRWTLEKSYLRLEAARVPGGAPLIAAAGASAGEAVAQPDSVHGPTTLLLFDLPPLADLPAARPRLAALAAGAEPGWRKAALSISYDGGATWQDIGPTAAPAVIGHAETALAAGPASLFDENATLDVQLLNEEMWLEGRDDAALVNGENLALLGAEALQFGGAEPLGGGRFRLSRLLRGRRGTEWAMTGHQAGEGFALVQAAALALIEPGIESLGIVARALAKGVGDAAGVTAERTIEGGAVRPPAPVHLGAVRQPNGDISVSWTRRSRIGWSWSDHGEVPLGEESEAYRLTLSGAGFAREIETAAPAWLYAAGQQAADGFAGGALTLSVIQLGTQAPSRPAEKTVTI